MHLPPSPQPPAQKLRPGIGWYLAGGAILGGGLVAAGVLAVLGFFAFFRAFEDLDTVELTGTTTLELDAGRTVVYLVGDGVDERTVFGADDLRITDPDGDVLAVVVDHAPPLVSTDDVYAPRLRFLADEPGTYTFEPTTDELTAAEIDRLAVGPELEELVEELVPWLLGAGGVALVGVGVGLTLLLVTFTRRRAARRRGGPPDGGPGAVPTAAATPAAPAAGSWADQPDDPWKAPGRGGTPGGWPAPGAPGG